MALLILRESNNTTRYTSKRPSPRHRPCFATPRSGHITTPRPNSSLARQWGNITMPHLGNTLARYPDSTQAPRPSNTLALHRVNPAPRQIHPRSASGPQRPNAVSGSTPVPHRAHNIPALPRGPSQEPRNKKSVRIATFLRLAIVASSPIANRGTKTQVICRVKVPFSLCGDREEFAIAKKLQRCRVFCFHDGWIVPTGRFRNGRITATGQITQMCVFSVAARVATSRATDRTKRPPVPCRIGLGGSPCAEGFAADWTERQPLGLGAVGSEEFLVLGRTSRKVR